MKRVFAIALAALLAAPALVRAEEPQCSLKLISSLDLIENHAGLPVVPVTFNGRAAKMILDTGAYWSGITPSAAAGLKTRELDYIGAVGAGGGTMRTVHPEDPGQPVRRRHRRLRAGPDAGRQAAGGASRPRLSPHAA